MLPDPDLLGDRVPEAHLVVERVTLGDREREGEGEVVGLRVPNLTLGEGVRVGSRVALVHEDTLALRVGDLVTLGDLDWVLHAEGEQERVGDLVKEGEGVVLEDLLGERVLEGDTDEERVASTLVPEGASRDHVALRPVAVVDTVSDLCPLWVLDRDGVEEPELLREGVVKGERERVLMSEGVVAFLFPVPVAHTLAFPLREGVGVVDREGLVVWEVEEEGVTLERAPVPVGIMVPLPTLRVSVTEGDTLGERDRVAAVEGLLLLKREGVPTPRGLEGVGTRDPVIPPLVLGL